ncbi:hypothetical protein S83_070538, partial [Arachis hypogaea]
LCCSSPTLLLIVDTCTISSAGAPSVVSLNPSLLALAFPALTTHGVGQPTEVAFPSSVPPFSVLHPRHVAQSSTTFEVLTACIWLNARFDCAVAAARRALNRNKGNDWPSASGAHRARYLRAIAAMVVERKDHLAKLESLDCGKPLDEAAWDMDDVAGCFEFYADLAKNLDAKQKASVSLPMETFKSYVLNESIGVVGLITPWRRLKGTYTDLSVLVKEIYNFSQDDLMTKDIFILDCHSEIFVWVGQGVDPKSRMQSLTIGEFWLFILGGETDLRFIYCAAACFHGGRDDSIPSPFNPLTDGSTQPIIHVLTRRLTVGDGVLEVSLEKSLILALSNPTSQSECTAEEAYTWSKGQAIFASGSPFDPYEYEGKVFVPGQANNAYIFPGFGFGLIISSAIRVRDEMLLAASEALATQVSQENYDKGLIYPPFSNIRKISAHIAANVAARHMNL